MKFRLLAVSVLIFLVFSIFLSTLRPCSGQAALKAGLFAQPSQKPSDLTNLLSGKSTDTQAVLSSIEEQDLPLALAVVKALEFKSLHRETKLSDETIEQFKNAVEKHLNDAERVFIPALGDSSFDSAQYRRIAPTDWDHIPAREITIESVRLTVPAHFIAPACLRIVDYGPKNEAGTLLPDIRVSFVSDGKLVKVQMSLDGKTIKPSLADEKTLFYRMPLNSENVLSIGTHSVNIALTDNSGRIATAMWQFTVGEAFVPDFEWPNDAVLKESVSVDPQKLFPEIQLTREGNLVIRVFENPSGSRFFEYQFFKTGDSAIPTVKSRSLLLLKNFFRSKKDDYTIQIFPLTKYAFEGNQYIISATYEGPGEDIGRLWMIHSDSGNIVTTQDQTVPWTQKGITTYINCAVQVKLSTESGDAEISYSKSKYITTIGLFESIDNDRLMVLSPTGIGKTPISCKRKLNYVPYEGDGVLVEGKVIEIDASSRLWVIRSRWKQSGGTTQVKIDNPAASASFIVFEERGYAELVSDVFLKFEHTEGDVTEKYEGTYTPTVSALVGGFVYNAKVQFEKFPPGIIFSTSRQIKIKRVDFEIEGEKRGITGQNGSISSIEPPIILANSELFPESPPLMVNACLFISLCRLGDKFLTTPFFQNFQTTFSYEEVNPAGIDEIPCQTYFAPFGSDEFQLAIKRMDWELIRWYFFPISEWIPIPAFPSPAELVQVEIEPQNSEVIEGQNFKFTGKIVPKPNVGSGEITGATGTLNLLDGYISQNVEGPNWKALLLPPQTPVKQGREWQFSFVPKQGTGTYAIVASVTVEVKENDTSTKASVFGLGSATAIMKPGLRILTPVDNFFYPFGAPIEVETTLDDKPDEWKKIQWFLNEKPWLPEPPEPKPLLKIEEAGKYKLKAVYKDTDNIELSSEVSFSVVPVQASISPQRKVLTYSEGLTFSLQAEAGLSGHPPIVNSEEALDLGNGVKAKITKVDWQAVTSPTEGVCDLKIENNLLAPTVEFKAQGALTALATVTITISKGRYRSGMTTKQEIIEETFVLPAVRADLWAIQTPKWQNIYGHFPRKAIAGTRRTFRPLNGAINLNNYIFSWAAGEEINPKIQFPPAVPGVEALICKGLIFSWKGPNNQAGSNPDFTPKFIKPPQEDIELTNELDFDADGKVAFIPEKFPVEVVPLDKVVLAKVNPESFTLVLDGHKELEFIIAEISKSASNNKRKDKNGQAIIVMEGAYQVKVVSLEWWQAGDRLGFDTPFDYKPKAQTTEEIKAIAEVEIAEVSLSNPSPPENQNLSAKTSPNVIAVKVNLEVTDLFGNVWEESEKDPGAFIHFNIDNDKKNTTNDDPYDGPPVADYTENDSISGENDLCPAKINLLPLEVGKVTLRRDDEKIRVWGSPTKEATSAILLDENEKIWDLSDENERKGFEAIKESLWVEGCGKESSGLAAQFSYHGEKYTSSDWVKYTFISANCGRQPTPTEYAIIRSVPGLSFENLVDCEWSITASKTSAYNCIAWSVGETDKFYTGEKDPNIPNSISIDESFGNGDDEFQVVEDLDPFYNQKGFDMIAEYADPINADVLYFEKFHAAKRKADCKDGAGKWLMFDSKLGSGMGIEHVWEQLQGARYGKIIRSYKKRRK